MVAPRPSLSGLVSLSSMTSTDCTLMAFFQVVARPNHLVA